MAYSGSARSSAGALRAPGLAALQCLVLVGLDPRLQPRASAESDRRLHRTQNTRCRMPRVRLSLNGQKLRKNAGKRPPKAGGYSRPIEQLAANSDRIGQQNLDSPWAGWPNFTSLRWRSSHGGPLEGRIRSRQRPREFGRVLLRSSQARRPRIIPSRRQAAPTAALRRIRVALELSSC